MPPPLGAIFGVGAKPAPQPDVGRKAPWWLLWRHGLPLRTRLLLLVVASVVPLVGMGLAREYLDYKTERQAVYDGLLTIARGTAVAVERDLQLRVSALEILAMSPALRQGDLSQFDAQAERFLTRLPPGSLLGIVTQDRQMQRLYGLPGGQPASLPKREANAMGPEVFGAGQPVVTDLHIGRSSGIQAFSVYVPVFHGGHVAYCLFAQISASVLDGLVQRQYVPPDIVLTLADATGVVVARVPNANRFVGLPIVPALASALRAQPEGIAHVPTLEGVPAIAAYSHIAPFNWAVIVGAPEDAALAPMRAAFVHVATGGAVMLATGILLAMFAARSITRPIEQLGRLAAFNGRIDLAAAETGLPETTMVAHALAAAAAERQRNAAALAESESRFRALFEHSPSGTILLDPDSTRVIDSNAVAASYVGLEIQEFIGRPITDFALQTSPDRIRAICRSVVGGHSSSYETQIAGRLGLRDLLVAVAPVQVSGRTLVLINQIDITGLRRAEAGLRTNEERLELARQGANLGIWDWDVAAGTLAWSEQEWRLHGLEPRPEGATPEIWQNAVHPTDLRRTQNELVAALKSPDHPYATEYSVAMPDGSVRRLLGRGQTIWDAEGRAVRMAGINIDVTARYEAEMARDQLIYMLETERARMSGIIEALPVGVGIVDVAGRVVLGNAAMKRLTGPAIHSMAASPRGEWIGHDPDGKRISPEDFPIRRALRLGETTLPGTDFLFRDQDGSETWIRVGGIPLRWEDGKVLEALGILLDIDGEKRLLGMQQEINAGLEQRVQDEMAAREAAQQRAAHAERMQALGQIAGGIAHDFNNVLQAVSGGAALIERHSDDPQRVLRTVRMVLDASRRGAAITSRLLAFSRRGDLRAENVDAASLLTDMAEVLTHTLGGSVACAVIAPSGLPPLFADRGQLETVLVNLATNARDAMPSGGTLTLSASIEVVADGAPHRAGLPPGRYVQISVADTGSGMGDAVLARVTEPFFTTKEPGKGTGLGLAMAKGFAEQSDGALAIDSAIGNGTRISLWLPSAANEAQFGTGTAAPNEVGADQPRVLLVDDDAIVREVLTLSLQDAGCIVVPADGGAAALSLVARHGRVDIIVSDLTMPNMDGLELIRRVQQARPHLPAILLTGYAGDGAALAVGGAISGTFSLLRKPVSGLQLMDRISALLESSKQPTNA